MSFGLIMNNRHGGSYASEKLRRLVGTSIPGRVSALRRETERLERVMAFDVRQPRGLLLGDNRIQVTFDRYGRIQFYSSDDSVAIERNPNLKGNVVDLRVASPGCANAFNSTTGNDAVPVNAAGCDNLLIVGETGNITRNVVQGNDTIKREAALIYMTPVVGTEVATEKFKIRGDDGQDHWVNARPVGTSTTIVLPGS